MSSDIIKYASASIPSIVALLLFWLRFEHRLTKVETVLKLFINGKIEVTKNE